MGAERCIDTVERGGWALKTLENHGKKPVNRPNLAIFEPFQDQITQSTQREGLKIAKNKVL